MVENPYCFAIGRFLVGISGGIYNSVMGKSLDETIPIEVSWQFGVLVNSYIVLGLILCYTISAFLPMKEDLDIKDDQTWRALLFAPAVIGIINILMFLCYYKQEPIAYSIAKGNEIEAKKMLRKIHHSKGVENFEELIDQKYDYLKSNTSKEIDIGLCEVLFGAKYRRASWTGIVVNALLNLTGINGVNVYIM